MKALLRDALTGQYWGTAGAWVGNAGEALLFPTSSAASQMARSYPEMELDVVLQFRDTETELALNPVFCR